MGNGTNIIDDDAETSQGKKKISQNDGSTNDFGNEFDRSDVVLESAVNKDETMNIITGHITKTSPSTHQEDTKPQNNIRYQNYNSNMKPIAMKQYTITFPNRQEMTQEPSIRKTNLEPIQSNELNNFDAESHLPNEELYEHDVFEIEDLYSELDKHSEELLKLHSTDQNDISPDMKWFYVSGDDGPWDRKKRYFDVQSLEDRWSSHLNESGKPNNGIMDKYLREIGSSETLTGGDLFKQLGLRTRDDLQVFSNMKSTDLSRRMGLENPSAENFLTAFNIFTDKSGVIDIDLDDIGVTF